MLVIRAGSRGRHPAVWLWPTRCFCSTVANGGADSAPLAPSAAPGLSKLLVANRGEIACRVLQTARRLGIPSVAVYSDADRSARHVQLADEAFCIGGAAARDSYLRADVILDVAARTGSAAVHPGYGFLSENATFSEACTAAGIAFVGPPAAAIRAMGNKSTAKAIMSEAGVPVVPGYHGLGQEEARLYEEANRIGFPLLVKAVSGGGGKGMKLATSAAQVPEALASAKREAMSSFGDDRVLLERYIQRPRHVEVQVFADTHNGAVYLFDRDCSLQRRHQKVIEEAPAPGLSPAFHAHIGEAAVRAARATGYVNAGTVEFIVDTDTGDFFFMEMNTRLQVEHPVTEAITGLDLVEWQLRVAAGEALPLRQDQLAVRGHAFEARIYAESPRNNFLPGAGQVRRWRPPRSSVAFTHLGDVRVDSGVSEGDSVGTNYDPMIAKLVTWGPTRDQALDKLTAALGETQVAGLPTNVPFLMALSAHPALRDAASLDTAFITTHHAQLFHRSPLPADAAAVAAVARYVLKAAQYTPTAPSVALGPWSIPDSKRLWHDLQLRYLMAYPEGDHALDLTLIVKTADEFEVAYAASTHKVAGTAGGAAAVTAAAAAPAATATAEVVRVRGVRLTAPDRLEAEVGGRRLSAEVLLHATAQEEVLNLWLPGGRSYELRWPLRQWSKRAGARTDATGRVVAPMPGKVVKVLVQEGNVVAVGDALVVMEAMKMEHTVVAPRAGTVCEVSASGGGQVADGQVLMVIAAAPPAAAPPAPAA